MWCLWRERNDRNFENKDRTSEELRTFFFYSLYTCTTAFLGPLVISFHDFLVYSLCTWLRFAFLMIFLLLIKNKKKNALFVVLISSYQMEGMDKILNLYGEIFHLGEWHFDWLLSKFSGD
jgi:hypothetical protein